MIDALRRHWRVYLMEAAGLSFFMIPAALMTVALEHPESWLHQAITSKLARHALLGLVLGLVVVFIVYNPWGRRSGAHVNPGITLVFLRLGRIAPWDAAFYIVAQFVGGIGAALLMKAMLGQPFTHPAVLFATTRPGPQGSMIALIAEFAISFVFALALLWTIHNRRLEPYVGIAAGVLIALYLTFETPLSGMSLNPARSFGSALAGDVWTGLWVYFVAPPIAMMLACECWLALRNVIVRYCRGRTDRSSRAALLCQLREAPRFPVSDTQ